MTRAMPLALDFSFTHTDGAWRNPGSWVGYPYYTQPEIWEEVARTAERGAVDMIFFGDGVGIPDTWQGSMDAAVRWGVQWPRHDMSALIPIMARATKHVGFCVTFSPTYMHPYYVARHVASLDHVSGGRMALNLITSARRSDAANYGFDELIAHAERYEIADEFIDVCHGLWSSVERDAVVLDPESGRFADPAKVHYLDHDGPHFKVRGPLNMVPCPQYHPLIVQAGASDRGVRSFARNADLLFAVGASAAAIRDLRERLNAELQEVGREPDEIPILWAVTPTVGESREIADARYQAVSDLLPREVGAIFLSHKSGFDFSTLPMPMALGKVVEHVEAAEGSTAYMHKMLATEGPEASVTMDDLAALAIDFDLSAGPPLVGTHEEVADILTDLHHQSGPNVGFMLSVRHFMPQIVHEFVDRVIPRLQANGVRPTRYLGSTLRDNFGLRERFPGDVRRTPDRRTKPLFS